MYYAKDAIEYSILTLFSFIIVLIGITICKKRQNKRISGLFCIGVLGFGIYLSTIFGVTISPIYGFRMQPSLNAINLIPFKVLKDRMNNPLNFYGNIAMFIPMGFLPLCISSRYRKMSRTVILGCFVSIIIECSQLFLGRGTDIDDVILNTIGTAIGFCVGKVLYAKCDYLQQQIRKCHSKRVVGFVVVAFICVMITGSLKRYHYMKDFNCTVSAKSASDKVTKIKDYDSLSECTTSKIVKKLKIEQANNDFGLFEANNMCVWNCNTKEILYGKAEYDKVAPASTTKMITAMVALKYCDLSETVTVGEEIKEISADSSVAGLSEGDRLTVKDLLYCLLLPSGNDAAYVLATYTGRKIAGDDSLSVRSAVEQFVFAMNTKAQEIGTNNTNFVRPDGYDAEGQYSTAYDLTIIAEELLKNETLALVVSTEKKRLVFKNGRDVVYRNTNAMLDETSDFYDIDVVGIKTGSSTAAGKCLVSGANIDGTLYICTVLGDSEEGRYQDSLQVYNSLKDNY